MIKNTISSLIMIAVAANASAAVITATVVDQKGEPVEGAVIYAVDAKTKGKAMTEEMDMQGLEFEPAFITVTVGDSVSFPNKDSTHHHVYSFSKAKKFDSRLYQDEDPKVVKFDKPGLVKVGCKIHDWMKGTVLVTPSSVRVLTGKDGKAALEVDGKSPVELAVYHPRLRGKHDKHNTKVELSKGKGSVSWELKLSREKDKRSKKNRKIYYK